MFVVLENCMQVRYDIINDHNFINRHIGQCNMHIIFINPTAYMCDFDTFDNPTDLDYPFKYLEDGGLSIVGSCRGVLCFSMRCYPRTTFFYNPTTQTYNALPSLPLTSTFRRPKGLEHIGFGYDHVSDDYKCVKLLLQKSDYRTSFKSVVMVYSLKEDAWKRGAHDVPYYINGPSFSYDYSVSLGGIVHWSVEGDSREPLPIVGFNLSDETFSSVPLPDAHIKGLYDHKHAHIGVLDGCLSVILNYFDYSEVWIMKEYGVVATWTNLYTVVKRHHYEDLKPISFSKNQKELLLILTLLNVAFLNLETLEMTNVQALGFERLWNAYICVENLLMFRNNGEDAPTGAHQRQNRKTKLRKLLMRKTERILRYHAWALRDNLNSLHPSNEES